MANARSVDYFKDTGLYKLLINSLKSVAQRLPRLGPFAKRLFGTTRGTSHGLDAVLIPTQVTTLNRRRPDARGDVSALAQAVERMWRQRNRDATCRGIPRAGTHLPKVNG